MIALSLSKLFLVYCGFYLLLAVALALFVPIWMTSFQDVAKGSSRFEMAQIAALFAGFVSVSSVAGRAPARIRNDFIWSALSSIVATLLYMQVGLLGPIAFPNEGTVEILPDIVTWVTYFATVFFVGGVALLFKALISLNLSISTTDD